MRQAYPNEQNRRKISQTAGCANAAGQRASTFWFELLCEHLNHEVVQVLADKFLTISTT
jgi:hypothetical protein